MLVDLVLLEEGSGLMCFVEQIAPYHHFLSRQLSYKVSIYLTLADVIAGVSAYMNVLHRQPLQPFFLSALR